MSDARGFDLLLPFDSDDPEFTRGVQIGIVWGRWCSEDDPLMVGADCAEMLTRMVERGAPIAVEIENDEWLTVKGAE